MGLSYSWWMNKHTRHHGNPNTVGKDPDIAPDGIRFLPEDAAAAKGPFRRTFLRFQGWLFFRCSRSRASTCTATRSCRS